MSNEQKPDVPRKRPTDADFIELIPHMQAILRFIFEKNGGNPVEFVLVKQKQKVIFIAKAGDLEPGDMDNTRLLIRDETGGMPS